MNDRSNYEDKYNPINEVNSMKTYTILSILTLAMLLAACGGSATQTSESPSEIGFDPREYPPQLQLSMGTFLLEDTDLSVTPEQAAELLPLWKAVRSLSESDTAAQAEIDALYNQIEETMTAEQLEAIRAMDPSQEDIAALMEKLGLEYTITPQGFDPENIPEDFDPENRPEGFEPGNMPGGGFIGPGAGGGQGPGAGMFSGDVDPETLATMEARREEMGGGFRNRMNLILVEPLIELLEERAAS
jgi:hypothetical protein